MSSAPIKSHRHWAEQEFGPAQLIDKRLNQRLVKIARAFAQQPSASIPQATGNAAQAQRCYDFFQNQYIQPDQILAPHCQRTQERAPQPQYLLAVNDTSLLDFSSQPTTTDLGPLATPKSRGLLVHPTLAVTPAGVPLGLIDCQVWARTAETFGKAAQRQERLITEKESQKWLHSYRQTADFQAQAPHLSAVVVGDREADLFALFELTRDATIPTTPDGRRPDLLVRAAQDRRVQSDDHTVERLWTVMEQQPVAGTYKIKVPRKGKQRHRTATIEVRFARVPVLPPKNQPAANRQPITLWAVWAQEIHPPTNVEPISWMLLTTIPVNSFAEAREKIRWYQQRWLIELLFKILKSGCQFEKRQLETADRLHRCLIIDLIVAWRILFTLRFGRQYPNLPCSVLLETDEWQALFCYHHQTTVLPRSEPSLEEMITIIAKLGGFLGRKNDGPPGITTLWRGLHRLTDIVNAFRLFYLIPQSQEKLVRND